MNYLIDTNVWLERLLNQTRSEEVRRFLEVIPSDELLITDFSLHSIGVIFSRLKRFNEFLVFVSDLFVDGSVSVVSIFPHEIKSMNDSINNFQLDFDDAYQYATAEKYDVQLVSFDSDFNRTKRGKKFPGEILDKIKTID